MNSREAIGSRECDARASQSSVTMDTVNRPLSNEATARLFCVSLLVAALCFVAIFPMPYGYYVFLRWVVCVTGVALAIAFPRTGYWVVALFAVAVAILFNPIVKVPLGRDAWKWFDAGGRTPLPLLLHGARYPSGSHVALNAPRGESGKQAGPDCR
jgi:hypothetical protein